MPNKFYSGYTIKPDINLSVLENYGFYKTQPKDSNPWWQCPFNIASGVITVWDCELLVNRDTRELFIKEDKNANTERLYQKIERMKNDGLFIDCKGDTFHEWMQKSTEGFGPEAMAVFDQYVLGEIDYDTCINNMADAVINFRIQKLIKENTK